jgi:hypothetical protein
MSRFEIIRPRAELRVEVSPVADDRLQRLAAYRNRSVQGPLEPSPPRPSSERLPSPFPAASPRGPTS